MSVFTTNTGKSKCCKSEVIAWTGDESTSHYECLKCGKDCDVIFSKHFKATAFDPAQEEINARKEAGEKPFEKGGSYATEDYVIMRNRIREEFLEEIRSNIGMLRQLINEKSSNQLLTNQDIEYILFK